MVTTDPAVTDPAGELPAGDFPAWLRHTRQVQQVRGVGSEVPCGSCTACCRSSLFIHIRPDETRTLARIPKALLFPAPGLPKGNVLMGYDERGHCPMLVDDECSIYADRPQTCRDFDCRVLAAAGLSPEPASLPHEVIAQGGIAQRAIAQGGTVQGGTAQGGTVQEDLAARVRRWRFGFPRETDRREYSAVRAAAAFLRDHRGLFPSGTLPANPVQLAALAISVHEIFLTQDERPAPTGAQPADIAKAVLAAIEQLDESPSNAHAR